MRIAKLLIAGVGALAISLSSCGQTKKAETEKPENPKAIVCYFSATGTTEEAAKRIAEITGADIHEIAPAEKYSSADLDWNDTLSRCYVDMHTENARPALKDTVTDLSAYTVVYLGYPNWWNTHPTIINTFIESNDLKGKTIVPFMTSGGSNITNSEKMLKEQYPDLNFATGMLMNEKTDSDIKEWVKQFE